ncbi:MAG: CRISPR-associated protein Cas5 [Thermoanaerobaculia bacterium]
MEVAGPLAMFTRPDTGGTPTSYPLPTWSAAKGILERPRGPFLKAPRPRSSFEGRRRRPCRCRAPCSS